MTAVPDGPIEARLPCQPDYYALVDHAILGQVPANGACARLTGLGSRMLQPVWDGECDEPGLVARAREICLRCPALRSCRQYATDNLDEFAFLGGMTAAQRRTAWTRRDKVAWRRRMVRPLHEAGAPVAEIAKVLATPRRTIEADIQALRLNGSRRRTAS
jgi:hypothetical protein